MKLMERVGHAVSSFETNLASILLLSMVIVMLLGIASRSLGSVLSMKWVGEVAVFLMFWCCFVGAALASRSNAHVKADLLLLIKPRHPFLYAVIDIVCAGVVSVLCFIFFYWHICYLIATYRIGSVSPSLRLPMVIPEASIGYGLIAMGIYYLLRAVRQHRAIFQGIRGQR